MTLSLRMAWRNLWRHKRRTWLTATAMIFSNVLLVFMISLAFLLFLVNLLGIGFGSWATGRLIDTLNERGVEEPMTYGTLAFGLVGMTSSIAYFVAARYYASSKERVDKAYG